MTCDLNDTFFYTIKRGYLDVVKYFIKEHGIDINIKDKNDHTALILASKNGQIEIVKYLIEEHKIDINIKNKNGNTALMEASIEGHIEVVKYLVEHGSDIHIKNIYSRTALILASGRKRIEVIKYLVEHGADINIKDEYDSTALMVASKNGQIEIVKYLIEQGADVNSTKTSALIKQLEKLKEIYGDLPISIGIVKDDKKDCNYSFDFIIPYFFEVGVLEKNKTFYIRVVPPNEDITINLGERKQIVYNLHIK